MICFALVGIASSLMWPGTLAAAADRMPHGGTPMFAFLALAGDVGCSVGPWASGVVNDITAKTGVPFMSALGFTGEQAALRCAILALGVFPFIMLVTLLFIKRKRKDTSV
jgi:MFS family permease